jgi:hypothetical protein
MNPIVENRKGSFTASMDLLKTLKPDGISWLFKGMIIVACAEDFTGPGWIRYTAYCRWFEVIREGQTPPEYRVVFHTSNGDIDSFTWTRIA